MATKKFSSFADYESEGFKWITLASGEYYPDILKDACELYKPVLVIFGQILKRSESSKVLFTQLSEQRDTWMRVQLARIFKKYVSPETPVEMLKKKTKVKQICVQFGKRFRPIHAVQDAFESRPIPDEALCAILWEYKDRGKKGYTLTEKFFSLFRSIFPDLIIEGPERASQDVMMKEVFPNYPNPNRPVDFVIFDKKKKNVLAIGLARYDSDRGGAQEDDRTGGYSNCADEILKFAKKHGYKTKLIFVNDGPGLLLGSMWKDYAKLEESWPNKIKVVTLRMVTERITKSCLTD